MTKKHLTIPEKHQLKIARDTLKLSPVGALIMGGMTHTEAEHLLDLERLGDPEEASEYDDYHWS